MDDIERTACFECADDLKDFGRGNLPDRALAERGKDVALYSPHYAIGMRWVEPPSRFISQTRALGSSSNGDAATFLASEIYPLCTPKIKSLH